MALKEDLAKLIDIAYFNRGTWLARAKVFAYVAPALAFGAWLAVELGTHERRLLSKGPLSPAHAPLATACEKCHSDASAWRPIRRLVEGDRAGLAALNDACLACHASTIAADASTSTARHAVPTAASAVHEELVACSACHVEHEGSARLSIVEDSTCARCHGDLSAHRPAGLAARVRGMGERIPSMAEHGADFDALARPDPSELRFNHAAHLRGPVLGPSGARVMLACADCHRDSASAGRFARLTPHEESASVAEHDARAARKSKIRYALHCAGCHSLVVDERLGGDADAFAGGVPHEAPSVIRSWLRGQLLAHSDRTEDAMPVTAPSGPRLGLVEPATPSGGEPAPVASPAETRLPLVAPRERAGQPRSGDGGALLDDYRPPVDPSARTAWVERNVAAIESRLYASRGGTCVVCHGAPESATSMPLEPPPHPAVPERWLERGRFDHARHEQVECARCHQARRPDGTLVAVNESTSSRDVLLAPGISGCKTCHATPPPGELARAPSRCTTCHRYHRAPLAPGKE